MEKSSFSLSRLISFRHEMHQHPEIAFEEHKTAERIISYLNSLGIENSSMKRMAKTGIVVDIKGKGAPSGKPKCVALRADMDALPMKEDNPHLEYQSKNDKAAHMCGHDGHVTCLLGGVSKIMENLDKIPQDRTVRLLFQPAEEAGYIDGGALPMIKAGCLDNVDECYGMHNFPTYPVGTIVVKSGQMMAQASHIKITFIGKGGHGSAPEKANDPLQPALDFHYKLRELIKQYKESGKGNLFSCTLPMLHVGEAINVIAEKCSLGGMLRSLDNNFTVEFKGKLQEILDEVSEKFKCKYEWDFHYGYPVVENHEVESDHIRRIATKIYGKDGVTDKGVPVFVSEDFSHFINKVKGAFFFMGTWNREKQPEPLMLHNLHYNFNDETIEKMSELWLAIVEDRLNPAADDLNPKL